MSRTHLEYSFYTNKAIVYKGVSVFWPKAKRMGIPLDILEREGELAFVLTYNNWKETGRTGSFRALLKARVHNRLKNFLRNEYRRTYRIESLDLVYQARLPWEGPSPSANLCYQEAIEDLSEDARAIVLALFESPEDLLEDISNTESIKLVRGAIKRWLGRQGWERKRINNAFGELGRAFG